MSGMFLDSYAVTDVLGSGRFSTVIGVRCLSTNQELAIKLVSKADVAAAMQQRSKGGGVSPPMGATPPPQPPDWGDGNNAVAAAATNNRGRGPTLSSGKALPERWADEAHAITHGLSSLSRLSDGAGPSPQAVPVQQGGPLRLKRIRTEYYVLLEQLRERHPLLVDVERIGHTNSFLFFAMKRYRRNLAELLRAPNSVRNTVLSEDQARFVTIETMLALEYLHYRGIVYRDLKPENILLTDDLHVVLSDFDLSHAPAAHDDLLFMELQETQMGLGVIPCSTGQVAGLTTVAQALSHQSKASSGSSSSFSTASTSQHHDAPAVTIATPVVSPRKHPLPGSPRPVSAPHHHTSSATSGSGSVHHQRNTSFVGTVEYLSPDVLKDDVVGPAIDMWSLGMLLYEMLFGFTAFRGNNESDTLFKLNEYISKGSDAKLSFPVSPSVSDEAKDLLQRLLCATKDLRLTPDDVRAHPWMARSSVVNIKMARDVHRMNSPLAAMVNHHDVHGASGDGGTTTVSANRYAKFLNKTPRTRPRGATTSTAEPSAQASAQDASARNALEVAADAKKDHVERHVASLRNEEMQTDGAVGVGLSFFFPVKKGPPPLQRTKEEIMRQFQPDALSACVSSPSLLRAALNEDTGAHEALPESREARGSWWSRLRASV